MPVIAINWLKNRTLFLFIGEYRHFTYVYSPISYLAISNMGKCAENGITPFSIMIRSLMKKTPNLNQDLEGKLDKEISKTSEFQK